MPRFSPDEGMTDRIAEQFDYAQQLLTIKLHKGNTVLFRPKLQEGPEDDEGKRASRRVPCIGKIIKVDAGEGTCVIQFVSVERMRTKQDTNTLKAGRLTFTFESLRRADLQEFVRGKEESFGDVVTRAQIGFRRAAELKLEKRKAS